MEAMKNIKATLLQAEALEMQIGELTNQYLALLTRQKAMLDDQIGIAQAQLRKLEASRIKLLAEQEQENKQK